MLEVENYKAFVPGAVFEPAERVDACSRCGRSGVERRTQDGLVCVHEETLEMMSDGLLVTPVDACLLEPLP